MNTLMPLLRPDLAGRRAELSRTEATQRNYLAIGAALLQCLLVWWLGYAASV